MSSGPMDQDNRNFFWISSVLANRLPAAKHHFLSKASKEGDRVNLDNDILDKKGR